MTVSSETDEQIHTSVLLQRLIAEAPPGHFTLEWMVGNLPRHSFGFIFLFLALIALLPVISVVARLLMIILALQVIFGYRNPVLPQRFMACKLSSKYLARLDRHAVPALQYLENVVRPRWPVMLKVSRRFVAFVVMLDMAFSLLAPIPLINMPVAAIGMLLALAYIEHDGLTLTLGFIGSVSV